MARETSLAIESTLSGGSLAQYLERARARGYAVTLVFVYLRSPELCLERIAGRVALGGRDVPEADVRRRYARAVARFWDTYRLLADDWMLVDNGGDSFVRSAKGVGDRVTVYDEAVWTPFAARANGVGREEDDGRRGAGE